MKATMFHHPLESDNGEQEAEEEEDRRSLISSQGVHCLAVVTGDKD